jgi:hypothetical protein
VVDQLLVGIPSPSSDVLGSWDVTWFTNSVSFISGRLFRPSESELRREISVIVGKSGSKVIVPYRDEDDKRHLKIMGDLGQIIPLVRLGQLVQPWFRDAYLLPVFGDHGDRIGMGFEEA